MHALQKPKKKASSREQIDLKGVRDGILVLPRNRYRALLHVSSVNFELMSETEQDAVIDTYESFLNSMGWPIQILVRTRTIDLDKYIDGLHARFKDEPNNVYRQQMLNYCEFIQGLVATNKILSRNFFVVVPYQTNTKLDFADIKEQLGIRVDVVMKGLARQGISSRTLTSLEVLDLFYCFYNQAHAKLQPLVAQALQVLRDDCVRKGAVS